MERQSDEFLLLATSAHLLPRLLLLGVLVLSMHVLKCVTCESDWWVFVSFISHSLKCKVSGVRPKEISNVKKSAESIFVLFLCTCLLTYLRFVFSQPARGSQFALGLTFFPWSTSMAPTAHTFSHSQQKHIFFVLPKCLQNLYQTESSPPCAINPE